MSGRRRSLLAAVMSTATLGRPVDPPAVSFTHDEQVHSFGTFGELVAHLREHHG